MGSHHLTSANFRGQGFVGKLQIDGAKKLNMGCHHVILVAHTIYNQPMLMILESLGRNQWRRAWERLYATTVSMVDGCGLLCLAYSVGYGALKTITTSVPQVVLRRQL